MNGTKLTLLILNLWLWGNMIFKADWGNPYRWAIIVCITAAFVIAHINQPQGAKE